MMVMWYVHCWTLSSLIHCVDQARLIRSLVVKSKKGYKLKAAVLVGTGGGKSVYVRCEF
jgi:hypothetical protein